MACGLCMPDNGRESPPGSNHTGTCLESRVWGSYFILARPPPNTSRKTETADDSLRVGVSSAALLRKAARGLAPQRIYNPPEGPACAGGVRFPRLPSLCHKRSRSERLWGTRRAALCSRPKAITIKLSWPPSCLKSTRWAVRGQGL